MHLSKHPTQHIAHFKKHPTAALSACPDSFNFALKYSKNHLKSITILKINDPKAKDPICLNTLRILVLSGVFPLLSPEGP